MVYAAHFHEEAAAARGYGWNTGEASFDWEKLKLARDSEIDRLSGIYRNLLDSKGVQVIQGAGRIIGPHQVQVGDKTYRAERVLITTGGRPVLPEVSGIEHAITSNEMFQLTQQPARILIVGGGYIGVEFAGIMQGLGSEVIMKIRGANILNGFDDEMRHFLQKEIIKKGIKIINNINVQRIESRADGLHVFSDLTHDLVVDQVLFATGRRPSTEGLGLVEQGVELRSNGAVHVNDEYQTSVPWIYALGDCTDRMNLTPIATAEATILAEQFFGDSKLSVDYEYVPSAVFSQPPLACVGYTETAAREKFANIDVYVSEFRALKHTLSGLAERFMLKIMVDADTDRVVGAHAVGMDAPEMMQGVAIAINAGASKADFDRTIGIHPTIAEEFCTLRTPR